MKDFINDLKLSLEKVDSYRDKFLFLFIKPYWPRRITPNHVTYVRLLIGILLFVLLFFLGIEDKTLIVSLFVIGVITDFIDGPIARGTNKVTEFGAMLDSTVDRILILPIAVYVLFKIHLWLLLVLILIEVANAILALHYKSKEIYLESNIFGKVKMVLICIVFIVSLITWPLLPGQFFIVMLYSTIPLSVLSALTRILGLESKNSFPNAEKKW